MLRRVDHRLPLAPPTGTARGPGPPDLAAPEFWCDSLNLLGQSGGMNGHPIYTVIALIVVLAGLALVTTAIRAKRPTGR